MITSNAYTSAVLSIPEVDTDKASPPFMKNGDILEGVSGRAPIDTMYENFGVDLIERPKNIKPIEPIGEGRYPHRAY